MKKTITLFITAFILNGCASVMTYKHNENNAFREAAYKTADPKVIQAYHNGDVHGLGIDLGAIDVIFRSPGSALKQTGAAILDVGAGFALYELAESVNSSDDDRSPSNDNGSSSFDLENSNNNTFNVIVGDDNDSSQDPTDF